MNWNSSGGYLWGFRPRDQGFDATAVLVGFMVKKVAVEHVCLSRNLVSPVSITKQTSVIQRTDSGLITGRSHHATKREQNKKRKTSKSGVK